MAELNIFHYIYKNSILHRMDSRIKIVCMLLFSIAISCTSDVLYLTTLSIILLFILCISRLPIGEIISELRYFIFLIAIVFCIRSFTIAGTPIRGFPLPGVTIEGVTSGLVFAWQLIMIIILCSVFTETTSLVSLRNAIEWFLNPIPFISATRIAIMVDLTFMFLPLIFDQICEILNAQKARCVEKNKNPIRRIKFLILPLLRQSFRHADEIAMAMESRCFSENRTPAEFETHIVDWIFLILTLIVLIIAISLII